LLILTRRVGESIVVGDDIVLTVFEVRGDAVRIGIQAPRSVRVNRKEIYEELQRANAQAVSSSDDAVDALRGALGTAAPDEAVSGVAPAEPAGSRDVGNAGKRSNGQPESTSEPTN
jgi:carbon storage regulator